MLVFISYLRDTSYTDLDFHLVVVVLGGGRPGLVQIPDPQLINPLNLSSELFVPNHTLFYLIPNIPAGLVQNHNSIQIGAIHGLKLGVPDKIVDQIDEILGLFLF